MKVSLNLAFFVKFVQLAQFDKTNSAYLYMKLIILGKN